MHFQDEMVHIFFFQMKTLRSESVNTHIYFIQVFSTLRLSDTPGLGPVVSVSFHPEDPTIISLVGERVLKLYKLHDKLLKTWGYQGGGSHNSQCQVNDQL